MNFPLAKEIYGTPWSIDPVSFMNLNSILKNFQNRVSLELPEVKLNSIEVFDLKNETRLISETWQLNNDASFEGIGVINLNGPITKSGGASSYGTKQLSSQMLQLSNDKRIKGFVILTDSGGGATGAVKLMQDAIKQVKQTKPVYALVEKGGMAGSAAYGIISSATGIYSEDEMNIVGSVGTMIQFRGAPNGTVDSDGNKQITLYATKSTAKNKGFEEAIENDNYEVLINDLLDPINESFISSVLQGRPQLQGTNFDNGHTVFSKEAIGTFIDGIASFDEVVSMILSDSKIGSNSNSNINSNLTTMTKTEIKQNHAAVYSEILSEGMEAQKEIVAGWMPFYEADSKAVIEGIKSGEAIKESQKNAFLVAIANKGRVAALNADNAKEVVTEQTTTVVEEEADSKFEEKAKAAFDFKLKIK
jgi:ClpP class serine protease